MTTCIFEPRTDTSSATICKNCGKEKVFHNHNIELPQQEISDEEIEKGAWEYVKKHKINGGNVVYWKNAIKWYREQLKLKQPKN